MPSHALAGVETSLLVARVITVEAFWAIDGRRIAAEPFADAILPERAGRTLHGGGGPRGGAERPARAGLVIPALAIMPGRTACRRHFTVHTAVAIRAGDAVRLTRVGLVLATRTFDLHHATRRTFEASRACVRRPSWLLLPCRAEIPRIAVTPS